MGAGFVARGLSGDIPHLVNLMKDAINLEKLTSEIGLEQLMEQYL